MNVETDFALVLKPPQHYHVTVFVFRSEQGGNFQWSTEFELVANDVPLAVDRAKRLAKPEQTQHHVGRVKQCSEPAHIKELKKK